MPEARVRCRVLLRSTRRSSLKNRSRARLAATDGADRFYDMKAKLVEPMHIMPDNWVTAARTRSLRAVRGLVAILGAGTRIDS